MPTDFRVASAPQRHGDSDYYNDDVNEMLRNQIKKVKDDLDKVEDDIEDDLREEREARALDIETEREMRKQEITI